MLHKYNSARRPWVSKVELGERRLDVAEFIKFSRAIGIDPYQAAGGKQL